MRPTILTACVLTVLALAMPASAQTPVPSPTPPTTLIAFDHDGVNTDGYRIKIDAAAAVAVTPTCAVVGAARTCEFTFPAMTPGNHTLWIIAWNAAGEGTSVPFAVTVFVAPVAPGNIRIVIR